MKSLISIPELDFEYKLWKNRLNYYEAELQVYLARLLSVKLDNSLIAGPYIPRIKDMISTIHAIKKQIQVHEEEIEFYKKDYPIDHKHDHYIDFTSIRKQIGELSVEYSTLIEEVDTNVNDYLYV